MLGILGVAGSWAWRRPSGAEAAGLEFSYPMQLPRRAPADGFFIRVAYAAENARYYPGWWHTGENWHRLGDETAGLPVHAIADGEVIFAGYDYPGLVAIVRHFADLYSVYGHLAYDAPVSAGTRVARGDVLGTVLARADDLARSHLHFEVRSFFLRDDVNGSAPQYGVACGVNCPPGPGYWPMEAAEHPSALGWRNPTHAIARRAWPTGIPSGTKVIVPEGAPALAPLWNSPPTNSGSEEIGSLSLYQGHVLQLHDLFAGSEAALNTGAEATDLWLHVTSDDGATGWVRAIIPSPDELASDGQEASLRFVLVPYEGGRGVGGWGDRQETGYG